MIFKRIKFKLINTYLSSSRMGLFRDNETQFKWNITRLRIPVGRKRTSRPF